MIRTDLTDALAELAMALADREDTGELLQRLAERAQQLLPVDSAGVVLSDDHGRLRYATATDDLARAFERVQEESEEGPCLAALDGCRPVRLHDLEDARAQFPRFAPAAADLGIRAVFTYPLAVRDTVIGSLNLLRREAGDLAPEEHHAAQLLADVTAAYIVNREALARSEQLNDQLQQALATRGVIEEAERLVAEQLGVDDEEAFAILRIHARRAALHVHEAAAQVVSGQLEIQQP